MRKLKSYFVSVTISEWTLYGAFYKCIVLFHYSMFIKQIDFIFHPNHFFLIYSETRSLYCDRKVTSIIFFDVTTHEQDSSSAIQGKFVRPRI